jgi:hypothetical protein
VRHTKKTKGEKKNFFHIRFGGVDRPRIKGKEFEMIYQLLRQPVLRSEKKGLHVLEIQRDLASDRPNEIFKQDKASEEETRRRRKKEPWGKEDEENLAQIQDAIARTKESINELCMSADKSPKSPRAKAEALLVNLEEGEKELLNRKHHRPDYDLDETKKAYNRLRGVYAKALGTLRDVGLADLAEHFDNHIKLDNYHYIYTPAEGISWEFDEPTS